MGREALIISSTTISSITLSLSFELLTSAAAAAAGAAAAEAPSLPIDLRSLLKALDILKI